MIRDQKYVLHISSHHQLISLHFILINPLIYISYPNKADKHPDGHQNDISDKESTDPDHSQPPGNELIFPVCPCQQVPVLDLLRFKPGRHIVLDDRLHTRIHIVQTVLQVELEYLVLLTCLCVELGPIK